MPRDWLAIRVRLLSGRDLVLDPPPGRVVAVGPRHSFADLAETINAAFARWDLGHLHEFELADGRRIGYGEVDDSDVIDQSGVLVTGQLREGDGFRFIFDLGDESTHRCDVVTPIDPRRELGFTPRKPAVIWGWGWIPDQYGREDDGDGWRPDGID